MPASIEPESNAVLVLLRKSQEMKYYNECASSMQMHASAGIDQSKLDSSTTS